MKSVVAAIVGASIILLGLYVSAYYLVVVPHYGGSTSGFDIEGNQAIEHQVFHPSYGTRLQCFETLFGPIHVIDQWVRPSTWRPSTRKLISSVESQG